MDKLIASLLSLSTPNLNAQQWRSLIILLDHLSPSDEEISIQGPFVHLDHVTDLLNLLNAESLCEHKKTLLPRAQEIFIYLKNLNTFGLHLLAWNHNINTLYNEICGAHEAEMGSDELLPLTIALLPENKAILATLVPKLSAIYDLNQTNVTAFCIVNLLVAMNIKLSDSQKNSAKTMLLCREIKLRTTLNEVLHLCANALTENLEFIKAKGTPNFHFLKNFFADETSLDTYAEGLISLLDENQRIVRKSPLIFAAHEKLICLNDLYTTLHRTQTPLATRLAELEKKLTHYSLSKNDWYSTGKKKIFCLAKKMSFSFFADPNILLTHEEIFLRFLRKALPTLQEDCLAIKIAAEEVKKEQAAEISQSIRFTGN